MGFDIKNGISYVKPILVRSDNINAKVSGAVSLGPNFSNKIFIPFWGSVAVINRTGSGSPPTISLGTNASAYDNIAAAAALTGLVEGEVAPIQFRVKYPYLIPDIETFVNVSVAATFTIYVIQVSYIGFLV